MTAQARLTERFWSKVDRTESCWLWTAVLNSAGYGRFHLDGKMRLAHRVAYEGMVGAIPEAAQLDHLCRTRRCVNPSHLEPVTQRENILRGESVVASCARATHCPQGHPYDDENTRVSSTSGWRGCRACSREKHRRKRMTPQPVGECPDCGKSLQARGMPRHMRDMHGVADLILGAES